MKTVMVMWGSCGCCRHCERSEAIHAPQAEQMDCFRFAKLRRTSFASLLAMTELISRADNTRLIDVNASAIIEL